MRSERTEMAFKERIFRIIEFPDTFLLVIYFSSISTKFYWNRPNRCWVITLENVLCKQKLKFDKTALEKKFLVHKQVPPPNAFMEN